MDGERPAPNIAPSWNVAPTDPLPVVRYDAKNRQRSLERLGEVGAAAATRAREQDRASIKGLAATYAQLTGDPTSAALIRDYVQRHEPRLERGNDRFNARGAAGGPAPPREAMRGCRKRSAAVA